MNKAATKAGVKKKHEKNPVLRIRIRGLFDPWIRDPECFFWIRDLGSQTHIFESLVTIF
jgi:hypothetical protein